MLSVLHVDPERRWGGGQVHLRELCRKLREFGVSQAVACHPGAPLHLALAADGLVTLPVPIRNAFDGRGLWRLRQALRGGLFQVVHFHTAHAHALSPWLPRQRRAFVVTRHMETPPRSALLFNHAVDGVIAICEAVRGALLGVGVAASKVRVIYLGIDLAPPAAGAAARQAQRRAWGVSADEIVVLTAAVLERRKGHRFLIEAISRLPPLPGPPARFVFCGSGSQQPALAAQVRAAGLADRVLLAGFAGNMPEVLAAADLFVLPSLAEGLPVVLMEAMAAKLPVIATAVSGTPEIVADGVNGRLVPPADPAALARVLTELLADPGRRLAIGQRGRARVEQHFSSERMAREFLAYYEGLRAHLNERRLDVRAR
ncbi:MAG: glycosyltransferase family 4 protein [Deltaproteobacteria bacterium]|nr:glycosyltransferase family 4 protein [Deltaproteobacteria bacterium]